MTDQCITFENLRWVHVGQRRGRTYDTVLDLNSTASKELAHELGESWYGVAQNIGYSLTTIRRMGVVLKHFVEFTDSYPVPDDLFLADPRSKLTDCLHEWELSLQSRYAISSNVPYKDSLQLKLLFRWHQQAGGKLSPLAEAWAQAPPLAISKKESPVDELPNESRVELRRACRKVVSNLEARMRRTWRLVKNAEQPKVGTPYTLGYLVSVLLDGDKFGVPALDLLTEYDRIPDAIAFGPEKEKGQRNGNNQLVIRAKFIRFASPSPQELAAFRILLLMETGWSPEQLTDVKIGDLTVTDDRITIITHKERARRTRPYTYSRGNSRWDTWALFTRLLDVTRPLRKLSSEPLNSQYLFSRLSTASYGRPIFSNEVFKVSYLRNIVEDHNVPWSGRFDVRRLRKTFKTIQGAVAGTTAGAAGFDHTVQVSREHYMQTTTINILSAQAVNAAQNFVHDKLLVNPTVVKRSAAESINDDVDTPISEVAELVLHESAKDVEMGVTSCRDPYDSPFTQSGKLCHVRPSACFLCPNALIFVDHLPRILAFRQMITAQRTILAPQEFQSRWGQSLESIEAILSEFTEAQLQEASTALIPLHVPLTQRIQLS